MVFNIICASLTQVLQNSPAEIFQQKRRPTYTLLHCCKSYHPTMVFSEYDPSATTFWKLLLVQIILLCWTQLISLQIKIVFANCFRWTGRLFRIFYSFANCRWSVSFIQIWPLCLCCWSQSSPWNDLFFCCKFQLFANCCWSRSSSWTSLDTILWYIQHISLANQSWAGFFFEQGFLAKISLSIIIVYLDLYILL